MVLPSFLALVALGTATGHRARAQEIVVPAADQPVAEALESGQCAIRFANGAVAGAPGVGLICGTFLEDVSRDEAVPGYETVYVYGPPGYAGQPVLIREAGGPAFPQILFPVFPLDLGFAPGPEFSGRLDAEGRVGVRIQSAVGWLGSSNIEARIGGEDRVNGHRIGVPVIECQAPVESFAMEPIHSIRNTLTDGFASGHPVDPRVVYRQFPVGRPSWSRWQLAGARSTVDVDVPFVPFSDEHFAATLELSYHYDVRVDFHNPNVEAIFRAHRVRFPLKFGAEQHVARLHAAGFIRVIPTTRAVFGVVYGEVGVRLAVRHEHTLPGYPAGRRLFLYADEAQATLAPGFLFLTRLDEAVRRYKLTSGAGTPPKGFGGLSQDSIRQLDDMVLAEVAPALGGSDFEYVAIVEWESLKAFRAILSTGILNGQLLVRFLPECPLDFGP